MKFDEDYMERVFIIVALFMVGSFCGALIWCASQLGT